MKRSSNEDRNAKGHGPNKTSSTNLDGRTRYSSLRYREGVVQELCGLSAGSVVLVATEFGMGRREILLELSKEYRKRDCYVEYCYLQPCVNAEEATTQLTNMLEQCVRSPKRAVAIIDNYPVSNGVYLDPLDDVVREASCSDVSVFVGSLPEGEVLFDSGVDLVSFWSSDLTIVSDGYDILTGTQGYTNGIPTLVFESAKAFSANISNPILSPSFATAYSTLVAHTQRSSLTREERVSCACMMLLGSGSISDLREVAGNIDTETFLRFARDEPILGVSVQDFTFSCAGAQDADAARICLTAFADSVSEWWEALPGIVEILMRRGDPERAARVCAGIPDRITRSKVTMRYFFPLINAGMICHVMSSCHIVQNEHFGGIIGASECKSVLSSLLYLGRYDGLSSLSQLSANTVRGRYAELCVACREQLRGRAGRSLLRDRPEDDELSHALATHGRMLSRIVDGEVSAARSLIMDTDIVGNATSILGLLLATDSLICSILCGDVTGGGGWEMISSQLAFLKNALPKKEGDHFFYEAVEMTIRVARVLAGEKDDPADFDKAYHHAVKHKDAILCGILLLGAAVAELRHAHLEGCDARLGLATDYFMKAGADFYAHACYLLKYVLDVSLGGRAREGDLSRCTGDSMEGNLLVAIVEDVATGRTQRDYVAMGLEDAMSNPPTNVLWILACILTCFGKFSTRVFSALPALWANRCARHLEAWGFVEDAWSNHELAESPFSGTARAINAVNACEADRPVRIRLLGGYDVWVEGRPGAGSQLEQRRAKVLLALLVCAPNHWVSVIDCCDIIWPSLKNNLVKARKNVSMAAGVLRSVLQIDRNKYEVDSVVSFMHGEESRIKLDESLVACDVDQLERAAKRIVGSQLDMRDIVKLGCFVEDLYVDDLDEFFETDAKIVKDRRLECHNLFVDAMKVAAQAAGEIRQLTCACRFARKAYVRGDMREDLLDDLVVLLLRASRRDEAEYIYDKHIGYLASEGVVELSEAVLRTGRRLYGENWHPGVLAHDEETLEGVQIMDESEWKDRHSRQSRGRR